ncbi:MAG: septum formation initiator family protein [Victivallaceae bacterium]|nr:septum formation initiator family protein [Victivallaceae bacterium]
MKGFSDAKNDASSGSFLTKFLVALLVIGALFLLIPVYRDYRHRQEELARLKAERSALQEKQLQLQSQVGRLEKSPEEIEKVAREKYNLVKEGESVMIYPTAKDEKKSR